MRKFTVLLASFFVFGACAVAQLEPKSLDIPKNEIFLGYAYQYASLSGDAVHTQQTVTQSSTNLYGFAFEFSHYLKNMNLGFTFDIARGAQNKVDSTGIKYTRTSYMAGPSYRLKQRGFIMPSLHVLAGVDHDQYTVSEFAGFGGNPGNFTFTNTDLAIAPGVTFDGNLSRHVGVRLAQVDYLYTHHYGTNQSSFRYAGGIVVRF